jgi:hypothetical protein
MMFLSSLIYQAAESKAYYSITFADCFTLATALKHTAATVICDPELGRSSIRLMLFGLSGRKENDLGR